MISRRVRSRLVAVCVGRAAPAPWMGNNATSGIDKREVEGAVRVTRYGVDGDEQADTDHHGGLDQALYAYAAEDADHWVAALGRELPPGSFGENLRMSHLDITAARIGERWRIGSDVEVEVTAPRIPCRVFAGFWDVPDLVARFLSAGRPGAYLRVRTPGEVSAGDRVEVVHRPDHELTVAETLRIMTRDRDEAARLVDLEALAERPRAWARKQVAAAG
jgi:MOSC domain-containing protein YiiM